MRLAPYRAYRLYPHEQEYPEEDVVGQGVAHPVGNRGSSASHDGYDQAGPPNPRAEREAALLLQVGAHEPGQGQAEHDVVESPDDRYDEELQYAETWVTPGRTWFSFDIFTFLNKQVLSRLIET